MPVRLGGLVLAMLLLAGCANGGKTAGPPPPSNARVPSSGAALPIPLSDEQRGELDRVVAQTAPARRARLRYALAADGETRVLVVYEGPSADKAARHKGLETYAVYHVLNRSDGATYDPEQNALIAPIAIPRATGA